jgi:CDP-diacylglycerol--serine O-phosphatidyltransferase
MGNLLCGFLAIISAHNGEPARAAWLIILGAFIDALDGRVARLSGSTSQFGKELDSLADIVTFGIAPAFLALTASLQDYDRWGFMVGAVYLMAGAFRLARYNVISDPHRKDQFIGLPIPIAAITICSYVILNMKYFQVIRYPEFLVTVVLGCSALMVSTVAYDSLPERLDRRENRWRLLIIFVFLIALLIKPRLVLFPFMISYVLFGVVREGIKLYGLTLRSAPDEQEITKPSHSDESEH